jgi:sporulation protein YlmC with PRC-barrel domain
MVLFSEMFASELIGDPVVDRVQENIGRVKDIIVTLGETFPRVTGLLIDLGDQGPADRRDRSGRQAIRFYPHDP